MRRANSLAARGLGALLLLVGASCASPPSRPDPAAGTHPPSLKAEFDERGCRALAFNGTDLLGRGSPLLTRAVFQRGDGSVYTGETALAFTPAEAISGTEDHTVTATSGWAFIQTVYAARSNRLELAITVSNRSPDTLVELGLSPLELTWPAPARLAPLYPDEYGRMIAPRFHHNVGAPTLLAADFGSGLTVLCNDDPIRPLTLGWEGAAEGGVGGRIFLRAGGEEMIYDNVYLRRPVATGKADTYTLSLRFAPGGSDPLEAADDLCRAYGRAFPRTLFWPDRRPITRLFFGRGLPVDQVLARCRNPESAPAPAPPDARFRQRWKDVFHRAVEGAKALDAQGILMWSIEGESFPHATTYIGDPRCASWLFPEMDQIADELIGMIRDAGLRPGFCIRPSRLVYARNEDPRKDTVRHSYADAKDAFLELNAKIQYCKNRWKAGLFYIDTNYFYRHGNKDWGLVNADTWRRLNEKHPDVLLIPEHGYVQMYAHTAPYGQMGIGATKTPDLVRRIWPDAFCVRQPDPLDIIESHDTLSAIAGAGAIFITSSDTATDAARNITGLREAGREAEWRRKGAPDWMRKTADTKALLVAARDPDPAVRFFAAEVLKTHPGTESARSLLSLLNDRDWLVRKAAAQALGGQKEEPAIAPLARLMREPALDWIAARALQDIGPQAVPALLEILEEKPAWNAPAVTVLGEMKAAAAVEPLAALVEKHRDGWRALQPAMTALGRIGTSEAVDVLLEALDGNPIGLRATAAEALGLVRDPRAPGALEDALARAKTADIPTPDLIAAIKAALQKQKSRSDSCTR